MILDGLYFPASFKLRRAAICFLLVLLPLTFASACSAAASVPELTPVTVQLSWTHQAEFAGLYAAEEQGYFQQEGLKVTFLEGGPEVDFIKPVTDGEAQFGIAQPADLILARADGQPVRSVAVIFRRSPIVFFSKQDLGITRP
jgi:NitT/TauT family transport system substrate-binding protein